MKNFSLPLLCTLISVEIVFGQSSNDNVQKIQECSNWTECSILPQENPITIDDKHVQFHNSKAGEKTRELEQPTIMEADSNGQVTKEAGAREFARFLANGKGVVITKGVAGHDEMLNISHEVLDQQGNTIVKISGPATSPMIEASPFMDYFFGYEIHEGFEGEPITFYDRTGNEYGRIDNIFGSSTTHKIGNGVHYSFSNQDETLVVSVNGAGLVAFSPAGKMTWKDALPGWDGRQPYIFPLGTVFVVQGQLSGPIVDNNRPKIPFEQIMRMPIEERRKSLLPKGFRRENQGIYCYSLRDGKKEWFVPGWGGIAAMNPKYELIAYGRKDVETGQYQIGLFDKQGLVKKWDVGPDFSSPHLQWIGDSILYLEARSRQASSKTDVSNEALPKSFFLAKLFSQDGKLLWEHRGKETDFDLIVPDDHHFAIQENGRVSLFGIK